MTHWLEWILIWASCRLPDRQGAWVEDLRHEAQHIPSRFQRQRFLWSGVQAAIGELLRVYLGPRRLGQLLFALAGFMACSGLLAASFRVDEQIIRSAILFLLILYAAVAILAVLNLKLMKRFTLSCSVCLLVVWMILGIPSFLPLDLPLKFLRALSLEASGVMMGLFIGGTYLAWLESPDHA